MNSQINLERVSVKKFLSVLLPIAVPIMLQSLLQTFINMLDTIMVGKIGSVAISAVNIGNQYFFILNMILFGITSGGGVFISQFWGKKEYKEIKRILGIMLILVVSVSIVFTMIGFLIPSKIISFYSDDPEVIKMGAEYVKIVCLSYVPTAISFAFTLSFRSTEHVKLPLFCTGFSLLSNAGFNYLFIIVLGYGVKGAAIATVISRLIEMIILLVWSYLNNYESCGKLREFLDLDSGIFAKFFKIAFPVIVNETLWGCGISVYNSIFGHISTDSYTSYSIVNTISQLTWVFCMGCGNGMGVIIGKRIGERQIGVAKDYASKSLWFMPLTGALVGLLLIPLSKTLSFFFNVDQGIIETSVKMLYILVIAYPFNSFCMNWIVGICRAGGDTVFAAVIEIVVLWCVAIPLGYLAARVLLLPAVWVYAFITTESLVKAVIGLIRVKSGKWLHDVTR